MSRTGSCARAGSAEIPLLPAAASISTALFLTTIGARLALFSIPKLSGAEFSFTDLWLLPAPRRVALVGLVPRPARLLPEPPITARHASLAQPVNIAKLLRAIDRYSGNAALGSKNMQTV